MTRKRTYDNVPHSAAPRRYDLTAPAVLFPGRFQPFHLGHRTLAEEVLKVHDRICFGIRAMPHGPRDPFNPIDVWARIQHVMIEEAGYESWRIGHILLPNMTALAYGRDVGYEIEQVRLPGDIERISATEIRKGTKP